MDLKFSTLPAGEILELRLPAVLLSSLLDVQEPLTMADLTEAEAAVYDRQLRVWGVDTQKRYLCIYF